MKKAAAVVMALFMALTAVAARDVISIGAGYNMLSIFDPRLVYHGPSLSIYGESAINDSDTIFFTDGSVSFPLEVGTAGLGTVDRSQFDKLLNIDMLIGAARRKPISNLPLSFATGGGLYINMIYSISGFLETIDLMLGLGLYADFMYEVTPNFVISLGIRPIVTIVDFIWTTAFGQTESNISFPIGLSAYGRLVFGFQF